MKTKLNILFDDARGQFANDFVASKSKTGTNYLRTYVVPNQPNTQKQLDRREFFRESVLGWKDVTPAQAIKWNGFANSQNRVNVFGQSKRLSGSQWFTQVNNNRRTLGLPIELIAPVPSSIPPVSTSSVLSAIEITTTKFTLTGDTMPAGAYMVIRSDFQRSAANAEPKSWRILKVAEPSVTIDNGALFTEYETVFETPVIGQRIWFELTTYNLKGIITAKRIISSIVI